VARKLKKIAKAKPKPKLTRILIFGTFDMVHPGHSHLFAQARKLCPKNTECYLIVSLARDKNVKRIKGKLPENSEKKRLTNIKALPYVDKAVLGALGDHIPPIVRLQPDIIALGYDQKAYVSGLRAQLKAAGISPRIIRLKPHKPHIYKTSLLKKPIKKPAK
jgi:FAD synthetase